jgi:hypothetical protein
MYQDAIHEKLVYGRSFPFFQRIIAYHQQSPKNNPDSLPVQSTIGETTVAPTEQSAVSAIDTDDHSNDFKINQREEK